MKKRIFSLILAISFLFSLVPPVRAEEKAAQPKSIAEQIRAFADSIDRSGAESSAATALAMHGITGGGKMLILDENSALTALLFNSAQFQYWLIEGCTNAIRSMQGLDMDVMPNMRGWCDWDSAQIKTGLIFRQKPASGTTDWSLIWTTFSDKWNDYDRSLEWMAGITAEDMQVTRTKVLEDRAVYRVDLTVWDIFDFHTANSSGFKDLISGIGMLMFKEFEWESRVSFTLEVPYTCHHGSGAYHWTYDAEKNEMISDSGNGYTENTTERRPCIEDGDYFALEETVRLLHDQPWVMEYDAKNQKNIPLFPVESGNYFSRLMFRHGGGNYIMLRDKRYVPAEENSEDDYKYIYGTIMQYLSSLISGNRKRLLTYRLENQVYPDGSNMIFLTILDSQTGTVLVDKLPMDDYSETYQGVEDSKLISKESDWLSGKDIYINYIGNRTIGFEAEYFDLRIWENGPGGETQSYYQPAGDFPATCTEAGHTDFTCAACGHTRREYGESARGHKYEPDVTVPGCTDGGFTTYTCACGDSYVADHTDPLGHNLTDWAVTNASTCTEHGLEERWCQRCDHREQRSLDPLGHDLTEWAVTNDPTCTDSGVEERWCQRCEHRESRSVDPMGHSYEATVIEPGCTVGGYTEYICLCGDSYRTNFTNPTGHHYEEVVTEPGCTEMGYTTYTCACGDSYKSNFTAPVGHRYEGIVTEPTCTEGGFTTYVCSCGDSYVSNYTNALGHKYAEGLCIRCGADDPNYQKPVENPFTDVPEDSFYFSPVLWAVENGITTGASADSFNPGGECMRAHVVTFLWRAAGSPEPVSNINPFVDVKESDFYYKAVLWAVEKGITNGSDATHFNPFGICNRAQVVTFLYRAFGSPAVESENNPFADVPTVGWYTAPVLWAVQNGITNGLSADSFGPDSPCNRAQVVTFLHRSYTN